MRQLDQTALAFSVAAGLIMMAGIVALFAAPPSQADASVDAASLEANAGATPRLNK